MKKILKFSILSIFAFLVFCGTLIFSMPSLKVADAEITTTTADIISISTPGGLKDFIEDYSDPANNSSNKTVLLTDDIDMSNNIIDSSVIGTEACPFAGIFDGNGHTISNLSLDFSDTAEDSIIPSYLGLFGVTNGATILDLEISGVTNISASNSPDVLDVGILVGKAENTTIENCTINSTLSYNDNKNKDGVNDENRGIKTINAGGMVGELVNSTIRNSIYRPSNASSFYLESIFRRDAKFGGIAGVVQNSNIFFTISAPKIDVQLSENFAGYTYIGGIFGTISQGNSKVINCVVEPTISVVNNYDKIVYSGAIGGYIYLPAPYANNISYVYYYSPLNAFGEGTNYTSRNNITSVSDTIITHTAEAGSEYTDARDYFESKKWNGLYGDRWDFANTFIIQDNNIFLQAFQGEFSIRVTTSSASVEDNIIILLDDEDEDNELEYTPEYNDIVQIRFKFNDQVNKLIGQYYRLDNLTLRSGVTQSVASFSESSEGYRLITTDNYDRISMTTKEENNGEIVYTITINGVTNNYTGVYQLNIVANDFEARFEYRLFGKDEETPVTEIVPSECYVYNKTGGTQDSRYYTVYDMTYNNSYTIATRADSRSIYEFRGWYLDKGDEEDTPLSEPDEGTTDVFSNSDLSFTFGQGKFALTEDFVVYAKYVDNSCEMTFVFDEGIERIVISTNENAITTTETTIKVKKQTNVKMELYLKENYAFDVQRFLDEVSTFRVNCTLDNEVSTDTYYLFTLDLAQISDQSFGDVLNLSFETEVQDTTDWTLIWISIGSVLGGLVLIAIIIIVVVVVKRKGGGGGGRSRKSSYRNMYY